MHTLISDGGSMTVGRRTANYTWGAFEVTLPEGLEQQEPVDDRFQDGYIYRPDDRGHGRAELTFVRADARIDMNASKSDLEQTLDGASERTKGDAYYTRQIAGVGLGKVRLGVDVRQGDMVRVLLWSRYLELPVTAIIPGKSVDGSTPDMAAQVGGQMLRDAELLSKRNSEIDTAIAAEKRERLRQVGAVDAKASDAQSAAESADGKAEQAKDGAVEVDESTAAALQAETENILNQLREQQEDLARMQSESVSVLMATKAGVTWPGVEVVAGRNPGTTWGFSAPDSRGALVHAEHYRKGEDSPYAQVKFKENLLPPTPGGWFIDAADDEYIRLTWAKPPAFQRDISEETTSGFNLERAEWTTVDGLGVTAGNAASNGLLTVRVRWNAASRGAQYGIRLLVDGVATGQRTSTKIGPLSFLGEGTVTQTINVPNVSVPAGRSVDVQVMSGAIASSARRVSRVELSGTWIEAAA